MKYIFLVISRQNQECFLTNLLLKSSLYCIQKFYLISSEESKISSIMHYRSILAYQKFIL